MARLVQARTLETALYRLTLAFDAVRARDRAVRIVVVSGNSGSGRSTTVQALYEYAAGKQRGERYWPLSLGQDGQPPLPGVLVPDEFTVTVGTRLPWVWWGLDGKDPAVVQQAQLQWMNHAGAFVDAIRRSELAAVERWRFTVDAALLIGKHLPVVGDAFDVAKDLSELAQLVTKGPTLFASSERKLRDALVADSSRRFSMRTTAANELGETAESVGKLARLVPLLVALDDAQDAPEDMFETLETILRTPRTRVLVVLTLNRDVAAADSPCQAFLDRMAAHGSTSEVELDRFTEEEIAQLCLARLAESNVHGWPAAGPLGTVVSAANGNPGRLVGMIAHRPIREALAGHSSMPIIRPEWLVAPALMSSWNNQDDNARTALATLACHGMMTCTAWVAPDQMELARATGWVDVSESGETSYVRFRDVARFTTAAAAKREQLSDREIQQQLSVVRGELERRARTNEWSDITPHIVLALLENLAESDTALPDRLLATLLRMRRESGRQSVGEDLLNSLEQRHLRGELLLATAEALADAGFTFRAIDLFQEELNRLSGRYGGNSLQVLPAMHNLAGAWAAYAKGESQADAGPAWQTAFTLFDTVIRGYERDAQTGKHLSRRLLPDTRVELANMYFGLGRFREARHVMSPAVAEYTDHLGPDSKEALVTREELCALLALAGDLKGAVPEMLRVLRDETRVLGPYHAITLATRGNLATFRGQAGDRSAAIAELEALIPDLELSQGPDCREILAARANLAFHRGQMGDAMRAVRELELLLPDLTQILGADDVGTLMARQNLALARDSSGDRSRAATELEALVPDLVRVLGPDHPETVSAQEDLRQIRNGA